jgi:hypothetical protein
MFLVGKCHGLQIRDIGYIIAINVLGLCEEADLKAQMFGLAQMFIRILNVLFSTDPAFSQNTC